jgi:hypothetical protein
MDYVMILYLLVTFLAGTLAMLYVVPTRSPEADKLRQLVAELFQPNLSSINEADKLANAEQPVDKMARPIGFGFVESDKESEDSDPQKISAPLLRLLPEKQREALLGDLEEEYYEICEQSGKDQAQRWYREQIDSSVKPLLMQAARLYLRQRLAWLTDLIRRLRP